MVTTIDADRRREQLTRLRAAAGLGETPTPQPNQPDTWLRRPLDFTQQNAANAPEGPVVIFGGPGTGKTHTMRERAKELVRKGASPTAVCLLTYNSHAAAELSASLSEAVGANCRDVGFFVGTFHRLCSNILRNHSNPQIGISPGFSIWDQEASLQAMAQVLNGIGNTPGLATVMAEQENGSKPGQSVTISDAEIQKILRWHSRNRNRPPEQRLSPSTAAWGAYISAYETEKNRQNAVDFDDLIHLAINVVSTSDNTRNYFRLLRTRHLLVDEFQDLGDAHYRLLDLLTGPTGSITVVCDPNQSIYSWRGTDANLIDRFMSQYPEAAQHILVTNHRSAGNIVNLTQSINRDESFQGLVNDLQRPVRPPGEPITILDGGRTAHHQYNEVADEIRKLTSIRNETPLEYSDIGIIFRNGEASRKIVGHLNAAQIPYTYANAPHQRRSPALDSALAQLELAINPWSNIALARAANPELNDSVHQRLNTTVLSQIRHQAGEEATDLVQAAQMILSEYEPGSAIHRQLEHITLCHQEIKQSLESDGNGSAERLLQQAYAEIYRYADRYEPGDETLERMLVAARTYDADTPKNEAAEKHLAGFLQFLSDGGEELHLGGPQETPKGVMLSTLHSAKGRQWKAVFFIDLLDNLIPGRGVREWNQEDDEEQRLFYVGISRALNRLYLCYPQQNEEGERLEPSRYLRVMNRNPDEDEDLPEVG